MVWIIPVIYFQKGLTLEKVQKKAATTEGKWKTYLTSLYNFNKQTRR